MIDAEIALLNSQLEAHGVFLPLPPQPTGRRARFRQFWAAAPASEWDNCYPVLRYMVHSWSDADGNNLDVVLPEALSTNPLPDDLLIDLWNG